MAMIAKKKPETFEPSVALLDKIDHVEESKLVVKRAEEELKTLTKEITDVRSRANALTSERVGALSRMLSGQSPIVSNLPNLAAMQQEIADKAGEIAAAKEEFRDLQNSVIALAMEELKVYRRQLINTVLSGLEMVKMAYQKLSGGLNEELRANKIEIAAGDFVMKVPQGSNAADLLRRVRSLDISALREVNTEGYVPPGMNRVVEATPLPPGTTYSIDGDGKATLSKPIMISSNR